jgi:hypothetical protein
MTTTTRYTSQGGLRGLSKDVWGPSSDWHQGSKDNILKGMVAVEGGDYDNIQQSAHEIKGGGGGYRGGQGKGTRDTTTNH